MSWSALKFFNHAGHVSHKEISVSKHLRYELMYRIHNSPEAIHRGITQTVYLFREHFYFPGFQEFLVDYIKNCLTCLQIKPIQKSHLTPPLLPITSLQNFPEELLQIDFVGALLASGGFKYILTAIDVFNKYLFAVPLKHPDAKSVAQKLLSIFHQHCYIPDTILSDLGSVFTSKMFKKLTVILQIQLNQATLKHPQTIGLLERSHAVLKKNLKVNINSPGVIWHNQIEIACFAHNKSFNSELSCTPALLFHGRQPMSALNKDLMSGKLLKKHHNAQLAKKYKTRFCSTINCRKTL